jgi:tetratricopeptide (TPR) repeat protein
MYASSNWLRSFAWLFASLPLMFSGASANDDTFESLVRLAETEIAARQFDVGVSMLARALEIAGGSADEDRQYDVLRRMADVHSLVGDLDRASDALTSMERISARPRASRSPAQARASLEIADRRCRIGEFARARRLYRNGIDLFDALNDQSALIDALASLARCCTRELMAEGVATSPDSLDEYRGPIEPSGRLIAESSRFHRRVSSMLRWEGEQSLRRAVRLADAAGISKSRRVSVLLQAGDWYQAKGHTVAAQELYSAAGLDSTSGAPDVGPLATPVHVLYPVPPTALRAHNPFGDGLEHAVEFELTIAANGVPHDIRLISGTDRRQIEETRSALRVARFRPRFERGKPVITHGVRFRQVFRIHV